MQILKIIILLKKMKARKEHWENVYATRKSNEVSWTQELPKTSLEFVRGFNLDKSARIIDVGGGDSKLVDFLLDEGYENVSVLDISQHAIDRAKIRLGEKSKKVNWIITLSLPTGIRCCTKAMIFWDRLRMVKKSLSVKY